MPEVSKVGGGVSIVRSPIRGICAVILSPMTLRIRCDVSSDHCFGREKL